MPRDKVLFIQTEVERKLYHAYKVKDRKSRVKGPYGKKLVEEGSVAEITPLSTEEKCIVSLQLNYLGRKDKWALYVCI